MGMPRKRKYPRWTTEMAVIPESRAPKIPVEQRDCCKPKRRLARLRPAATHQPAQDASANDASAEQGSIIPDYEPKELMAEEPILADTTTEGPAAKKLKSSPEKSTVEAATLQRGTADESLDEQFTNETSCKLEEDAEEIPDFKDVWGYPQLEVCPNSRRNKDMLWSLVW